MNPCIHRVLNQQAFHYQVLSSSSIYRHFSFVRYAQDLSFPFLARKIIQPRFGETYNFAQITITRCLTRSSSEIITKPNLFKMKLDTPEFHSIFTPELKTLIELFKKYNHELRIAGGAVRDLIAKKIPEDIDFATTATPSEMKELFTAEGIRIIDAKGEAHGTIKARINDTENFEVTTLRIDKVTYGRRAEVEFTTDWMLDSKRRDLTVNSMFLGFDGTVFDYFNGLEDLKDKRIRFVGTPEQRIQEDYLRILRYFRFYGRLADSPDKHEEINTTAIRENAQGLAGISGQRVWMEVKKILSGKMAAHMIRKMVELGLGSHIGLPNATNFEELDNVCERTKGAQPHPMTLLAAVFDSEEDVYTHHKRNKISNEELSIGLFIVHHRNDPLGSDIMKYCTDLHHTDSIGKDVKVKEKIAELMKYRGMPQAGEEFLQLELPVFPISGHHLVTHGLKRGPKFSLTLNELRRVWKESDYKLGADELSLHIPDIIKSLPDNVKKMKKNE